MDVIVLIGRILLVALFIGAGYGHLTQTDAMSGYAQSKGVPSARLAVQVSGVLILVGGVMVLLGIWPDLGALLLFIFLVPTALLFHAFWKETDPQARQMEMVQFQKDMALAGASLLAFALFASAEPGLSITGPLFHLS